MASYKELKAKAQEILKQAEEARLVEIQTIVAEIRAKMAEFNITLSDLRERGRLGKKKRLKVAPKYRDPTTGHTWSGRGKMPKWLVANLKKGKKKESYRIKDV